MRRKAPSLIVLGVVLAAAVALPRRAWPWGCEGHQIVARIAEWHLTPRAAQKSAEILAQSPIDTQLERFCGHGHGFDAFVDGSTWADDVRDERYWTSDWHFLDIPRDTPPDADLAAFCPSKGCVTTAIEKQLAVLRSTAPGTSKKQRAEALRFVVHFVGDVHQPMHDVANADRGGNCVPVTYLGRVPQPGSNGKYSPNLHQIWDSGVIKAELEERDLTVAELASRIDCRFQSQIQTWLAEPVAPLAWAREGHRTAEEVGYGKLSPSVPVLEPRTLASCAQGGASQKMLALHLVADEGYQSAAAAAVEEQLARAGARLAAALNAIWP
ncbi:S1/P1 nuclease [Candidatus Binatia bacterium]|nr:S1/P1 nuclease [Candidatus Binatia bacterium]